MAALFLAAGLASAPAQAIGVQKEMKVGFIYISPIGEGGWSYAQRGNQMAVYGLHIKADPEKPAPCTAFKGKTDAAG